MRKEYGIDEDDDLQVSFEPVQPSGQVGPKFRKPRASDFAPSSVGSGGAPRVAPATGAKKQAQKHDSDEDSSPWSDEEDRHQPHTGGSAAKRNNTAVKSSHGREGALNDDVSKWEINPNELQLGRKLGKGAFGTVYKSTLHGKEVAVKKLSGANFDEETIENFRKEVAILSKLRHPNVILFMGACTQPGNLMIVTEYMERGSVYDLLHDKNIQLSFRLRMKWAKEAALGMNWLHKSNPVFIHRDLKTGNLLVDKNWIVKVCDFGLSHVKKKAGPNQKGSYGAIGTPLWMAPEVLLNKEYDESADLYSFGIVLWELLTQQDPFPDIQTFSAMLDQVCIANHRPVIPDSCPKTLRDTINRCWDPLPERRPTFDKLLSDSIFDDIILEASINDRLGRELWRRYFVTKEEFKEVVSYRDFLIAFTGYFRSRPPSDPDDVRYRCLKAVLVKDEKVTIDNWMKVLEWFGPLESLDSFLDRIVNLLAKPWFFGEMSADAAEKLLRKEKKGTFMFRFSSRDPGHFAITTLDKDNVIKHYKVVHQAGGPFIIGKIQCSSLDEVVSKYKRELYLRHSPENWPFEDIFAKRNRGPAVAGYQTPDFM